VREEIVKVARRGGGSAYASFPLSRSGSAVRQSLRTLRIATEEILGVGHNRGLNFLCVSL
jgi:hypothetical protein